MERKQWKCGGGHFNDKPVLNKLKVSEINFPSKAIARTIALSKSTRFYLEDKIDST